ncbi:MAG TPA: GH1 family beta-glucosidase [Actinomycetaceae bacterium]|nr:GH1 family beta-glucosidase [Actinomycetaceae bacterium]
MTPTNPTAPTTRALPTDFLLGGATAAFQIEGAAWTDGRTDSIWDVLCRVPGAVAGGDTGAVATDHYHRYREDVALMSNLGLQAYRFSTSWARVRPDGGAPNPAGIAFYDRLVDELLQAGITPFLTLYHWDLPQALQETGGWTNRDTAHRFVDYAVTMHEALGDRVRHWSTLNEPWCSSFLSYAAGEHAPGRTEPVEAVQAAHHLLLAHGLATRELRARDAEADLGIVLNFTVADPADPQDPADVDAARRIDGLFNRIFLDPIFRGEYPADIREDLTPYWPENLVQEGDLEAIATPLNYLGVNYYNGGMVAGPGEEQFTPAGGDAKRRATPYVSAEDVRFVSRGLPRTAMDWEIQPEGLTRLLTRLQQEYTGPAGIPMYVTENGAAFDDVVEPDGSINDTDRLDYLRRHVAAALDAIEQGVDLRGYFVWSVLDNFEWAYGYAKRFGIVRVDFETLERTPKASALWYADLTRSRTLDAPVD